MTAIGLSGQMHGTVCLDRVLTPVRPAIIWADVRSAGTARDLTRRISPARLADVIGTPLAAGFQAVTLEWLRRSEPEAFANTAKVLLPKDYLRLRLTGEIATEPSDAASTGLLEVRQRRWSAEILEAIGLKEDCLPPINRSTAITGYLTAEAQSHLKIQRPVPVCGGGADAPLAALASGVSGPGQVMLTLSSGAQATSFVDTPNVDPGLRTHTFASPLDPEQGECGWYVMGATMAAGTAVRWLTTNLLGRPDTPVDAVLDLGSTIDAGAGGLIFVPYLAGSVRPTWTPRPGERSLA